MVVWAPIMLLADLFHIVCGQVPLEHVFINDSRWPAHHRRTMRNKVVAQTVYIGCAPWLTSVTNLLVEHVFSVRRICDKGLGTGSVQ